MVGILRRAWLPLLIVAVVAVGAVVVYRMHGFFGSNNETTRPGSGLAQDAEPFNPKVVVYEITGPTGTVANINYLDLDATPHRVDNAPLPWSLTLKTTKPSASATIIAQGDGDSIGCRVLVDDEVRDLQASDGVNAQTSCLVKSL
ncbi:MmpS family transport accessory protein [Mycobacterium kyogaense]|uniref:MmpS family transport accessory protein n=1 Tax=Mycobacterium kyogaense TaxID=2212479 RepID=UPI000DABE431|nr:MmpS family transport accessory protein [Mycobacterium kyogaense]